MINTKIICTIGPASDSPEMLAKLADVGMNIARLNFSHGSHEDHLHIVEHIRKLNSGRIFPVAILLDTQGPEIRTGSRPMMLETGSEIEVACTHGNDEDHRLFIDYPELCDQLDVGEDILLDSGMVKLSVAAKRDGNLVCRVLDGGFIGKRRHVNLPGVAVKLPGLTENDRRDLRFAADNDVDAIALSFLRDPATIQEVRSLLGEKSKRINIFAKIENQEGVDHLEEIIREADGIMVARGDLGIEIDMEELPQIQRRIAYLCAKFGKRLIVATQLLESMMENPVPTRAEITDIANAVFEEADAIMLSGETSTGKYPVRCVETLVRIARRTEAFPGVQYAEKLIKSEKRQILAAAACRIAHELKVPGMLVITRLGRGATKLSNLRPRGIPIFAFTNSEKTRQSLALVRSVHPYFLDFQQDPELTIQDALHRLKVEQDLESGASVVVVADILTGEGHVNCLQIRTIP